MSEESSNRIDLLKEILSEAGYTRSKPENPYLDRDEIIALITYIKLKKQMKKEN